MLLEEIKPLQFGFYKKKSLDTENMITLYKKDDLINDLQVLKTISKYSKKIYISRRSKGFIYVYNGKNCFKFQSEKSTCMNLERLFKKFTACSYLDCLIMNLDSIYYSLSRLDSWDYAVNLYYCLDRNYTNYQIEDVFTEPKKLLGDYEMVVSKDSSVFKLEDFDENADTVDENVDIHSIDIAQPREVPKRTITHYEKKKSLVDRFFDLFCGEKSKANINHTIRYGRRENNKLYCKEKAIAPIAFNNPSETKKLFKSLIDKVKGSSIDYIEIDCEALIYIIKNNKGVFIFANLEIQNSCGGILKDFHNVFVDVSENYSRK
ncbi:hypothetical protein NGRA_0877 [Nosema granulosis]|uniref:Uncharacterized protein n=1 Tax=Nosema granulosis TaxID=83296 RepID=A0A9P6H037_9MICR|nr:hypothetical protein NGRA_0877 [Nosema granulosis]